MITTQPYPTRSMLSYSLLTAMGALSLSFASIAQADDNDQSSQIYPNCAEIVSDSIRLACYDNRMAMENSHLTHSKKRQIDLDQTIKSALEGKPKLVIDNQENDTLSTANDDSKAVGNQSIDKKHAENSYFLNTEVIRTLYKTGDYQNANRIGSKKVTNGQTTQSTINVTNKQQNTYSTVLTKNDKQIVSKQNSTNDDLFVSKSKKNKHKTSALSRAYDLDKNSNIGLWKPRMHKPLYILPLFMHDKPNHAIQSPSQALVTNTSNDYRSAELKFQFSLKSKVAQDLFDTDADMWVGYTQQSHWQVYNEDNSRPFRATDYMPELFLTQPVKASLPFGGQLRMLGAGAIHHSNGEDDPLSRSWNRIYLMGGAEWGNLTVVPRVWKRVQTKATSQDDNPDIEDFYGYGDLTLSYDLDDGRRLSGTFRYNPSTSNGSAQVDYIYPMDNKINLYMNLFHGYGESLIDYNHKDTTVGIGIMLND